MMELPEAFATAKQLRGVLQDRTVQTVHLPTSRHKFAFFNGDVAAYPALLEGQPVTDVCAMGGMVELRLGGGNLLFGDGVLLRWLAPEDEKPAKHQLMLTLDNGGTLYCQVQMYGGMWAFANGAYDNTYYRAAAEKPSPLGDEFDEAYFAALQKNEKPALGLKAFLATEQRIPGLGNGCLQDILFLAGLHPKTRLSALDNSQRAALYHSVKDTLRDMADKNGRNTEKDLFGRPGGYTTILSSKTWKDPCPRCGGVIERQAYLGGNIYFCPACQPQIGE